jgi:hypothetical protein
MVCDSTMLSHTLLLAARTVDAPSPSEAVRRERVVYQLEEIMNTLARVTLDPREEAHEKDLGKEYSVLGLRVFR